MVPHRRILQAVALVAMARADGPKHAEELLASFDSRLPCDLVDFTAAEIQGRIPAALEAWFLTTDIQATLDYRPLFQATQTLALRDVVTVGPTGPTVVLPAGIKRLRDNQAIRTMLETSILCEIDLETICDDLKRMYGCNVDEADIRRYAELFVDREYIEGESWERYMRCIGNDEAVFRRSLIGQPKDFVRWRLGVPVSLNSEEVLNRLMSDAYYTERLIKRNVGNLGINMTKDELARVKLERDTMFKAMEMRSKMKDAAGGDTAKQALATLAGVVAKYESQDALLTKEELAALPDG
jgi:hypothetical protein